MIALALFAAITLLTAFTATSASAKEKEDDHSFKGVMVNNDVASAPYEYIDPETGEFQLRIDVEIEGEIKATLLGKGKVEGSVTINFWPFLGGGCSSLVEGTIDFTASNGDVLNMVMTVNELCAETGLFTGEYDVVGGTGRFKEVEGVINASGMPMPGEPSVTTLSGTLELDKEEITHKARESKEHQAKNECTKTKGTWVVDEAGVTHATGDLNGSIQITSFVPGDVKGSWLHFTGTQTFQEASGNIFADLKGKINLEDFRGDIKATYTSGTGDWEDVSGGEHIKGVNLIGGKSHGKVCS